MGERSSRSARLSSRCVAKARGSTQARGPAVGRGPGGGEPVHPQGEWGFGAVVPAPAAGGGQPDGARVGELCCGAREDPAPQWRSGQAGVARVGGLGQQVEADPAAGLVGEEGGHVLGRRHSSPPASPVSVSPFWCGMPGLVFSCSVSWAL